MACLICNKTTQKSKICSKQELTYVWDSKLQGIRLKKRNTGSRYTQDEYHKTETNLVKIVERIYGKKNVVTAFHPIWAKSDKGVLLEFDIYVPKYRLLIEYNGRQHYEFVRFFHKTLTRFRKQKRRDRQKACLARANGYRLVVIKYDEPITKQYIRGRIS